MDWTGILVSVVALVIIVGFLYILLFMIPKKAKRACSDFVQQLESTGFKTSKRIVTTDYTPRTWWYGDLHVGLWVDYNGAKLAMRTSRKDVTPQVFDFKDLQDFETIDGPGVAKTVGHGHGSVELSRNIVIRLVIKSKNGGINSVQMPLWKFGNLYGRPDANSKLYQRLCECSRAIRDELNNILQINANT